MINEWQSTNGGEPLDEADVAPRWYKVLAIGVAGALIVLAFLVLLLVMLQMVVRRQQAYVEELLEEQDAARGRSSGAPAAMGGQAADAVDAAPMKLSERDVMSLINGDSQRLEELHALALSPAKGDTVADIVKKGCKANRLKLGKESEEQIANGLLAVADVVLQMRRTCERDDLSPKERLQRAAKQVLSMVRVCRAFNQTLRDHEESGWTEGSHQQREDHYSSGAAKNGTARNLKISAEGGLRAYFASGKWVDHAGIALILTWSQTCGIIYAIYLRYRFPQMYDFMGPWVLVSRGEAMAMVLLTVLMILLMTRGLMTRLRPYCGELDVLTNIVDKHALMHQWCGILLVPCAFLHVLGHLKGSIPAIINETDNAKVSAAFTYGTKLKFNFHSWSGALLCYPAVTGFTLVALLLLFWSFSNERVRRMNFELFHYPHLFLLVAWSLGLWAHGARQWLGCGVPLGLLVVVPTVCVYMIERLIHVSMSEEPEIKIMDAHVKKTSVLLEINTEGSSFTYSTGMYCMLKVPAISDSQWHPFTIASSGGAPVVRVLFAVCGDWTTSLKCLVEEAKKHRTPFPRICLRGGYGAPAQHMKDCKHVVLVGAGVGATPFLSFLASICESAQRGEKSQFDDIETAVFYWLSREPEDFVWVNQYSTIISEHPGLRDRVSVRLCLTKALETTASAECSATEVALFWMGAQVALSCGRGAALAKELGAPTQFGRPNWVKELGDRCGELLAAGLSSSGKVELDVFVCGNPMLVQSLQDACDNVSSEQLDVKLYAEQF